MGNQGVSAEMSVIGMDRQVDGTSDEQSSLHVGVSPVPQGCMSFLDDLGRCPAQDVVGASRLVIGSCGKENAHWFLAGGGHAGWQSEWGSTGQMVAPSTMHPAEKLREGDTKHKHSLRAG